MYVHVRGKGQDKKRINLKVKMKQKYLLQFLKHGMFYYLVKFTYKYVGRHSDNIVGNVSNTEHINDTSVDGIGY